MPDFSVGRYLNPETDRYQWAVFEWKTGCWYFASQYGYKAAERLARKLNKEIP